MATAVARKRKCPICGRAAVAERLPFCSRRCADIDLNRWLSGSYVIPSAEETPSGEETDGTGQRDETLH